MKITAPPLAPPAPPAAPTAIIPYLNQLDYRAAQQKQLVGDYFNHFQNQKQLASMYIDQLSSGDGLLRGYRNSLKGQGVPGQFLYLQVPDADNPYYFGGYVSPLTDQARQDLLTSDPYQRAEYVQLNPNSVQVVQRINSPFMDNYLFIIQAKQRQLQGLKDHYASMSKWFNDFNAYFNQKYPGSIVGGRLVNLALRDTYRHSRAIWGRSLNSPYMTEDMLQIAKTPRSYYLQGVEKLYHMETAIRQQRQNAYDLFSQNRQFTGIDPLSTANSIRLADSLRYNYPRRMASLIHQLRQTNAGQSPLQLLEGQMIGLRQALTADWDRYHKYSRVVQPATVVARSYRPSPSFNMPATIVIPDSTVQSVSSSLGSSGLMASNIPVVDSSVFTGSVLRPQDLNVSVPGSPRGPPFSSYGFSDGSSFYAFNHAQAHQFPFSGDARYVGYRRSRRWLNRRNRRRRSYYLH